MTSTIDLRYYQEDAIDAVYEAVERGVKRPLAVLPTGAGKSVILGSVAQGFGAAGSRVIVLAHVTELVEQNAAACAMVGERAGVYSAKLKRRDLISPIVSASVQSVAARLRAKGKLPQFDVAMIDEAHRVSRDSESQYHKVLEALGVKVVIGLTATPYRLDSGRLDRGVNAMFEEVVYDIPMEELIDGGYLTPLVSVPTDVQIDTANLHTRAGEYIQSELEEAAMEVLAAMTEDLFAKTRDRRCVIVFSAGVKSAKAQAKLLSAGGARVALLTGDTPDAERAAMVKDVKAGRYDYVVNVGVATTGFDAPNIDCVALCRPTQSKGLRDQMLGRGVRLFPGKEHCAVLDYGGNISRLGKPGDWRSIDDEYEEGEGGGGEAVEKECPACGDMLHASVRVCSCGYWFPQKYQACKDSGLMLPGGRRWFDVLAFTAEHCEDGMRLGYLVQQDEGAEEVMLDELVEFDGTECPMRWRQVGGYSKTLDKAAEEAQYLDGPGHVLAVKDGDAVVVGGASMRDPRRRR